MSISHEELKRLLRYDPETGCWTRLVDGYRGVYKTGDRADTADHHGYRRIAIAGKKYYSQRLAVFYMTGAWPAKGVDHEDLNTSNNRWKNLRAATQAQNGANQRIGKNNTSGRKGICWDKPRRCWRAQICVNNKMKFLGRSAEFDAVVKIREAAEKFYFGEFARVE
jgi:hypothetical protein